jgi:outer membrane lipoprotein-sorting protein
MRRLCCASLVVWVGLSLTGFAAADDQADARAIIDKAITASGGKDLLAKFKAQTWKEKGTYYGMGQGLPYTGKYDLQWPGQFRMEIEGVFSMVVNGDQGWMKDANGTNEMTKEQLASEKQNMYGGWVASLVPLQDKGFTLTPLKETKVEDRPAVGVKVARKGHGDVQLFFDKATGLLAKSEYTVRAQEQRGKEVKQEVLVSNYKEVSGIRVPTKVVVNRDGKLYVEAQLEDIKPMEKLDDKVFSKP